MNSPNIPSSPLHMERDGAELSIKHSKLGESAGVSDVNIKRGDARQSEFMFRSTAYSPGIDGELAALFASQGFNGVLNHLRANNNVNFVRLDPATQVELEGSLVSQQRLNLELGEAGSYLDPTRVLDEIVGATLSDQVLMDALTGDFASLQTSELFLIDPESYRRTYPDLCIRPIILDPFQEQRLSELVYSVLTAKIALVNSLHSNPDLFELIYQGVEPTMREIFQANLDPLPDSVRVRLDTHTSLLPGPLSQIETNGSEPQGDAVTTATLSLFKRLIARHLTQLGATPEQVEYCFSEFRLPIHQISDEIEAIYASNYTAHSELPENFNVGVLAWKHYKTRAPLSNISNTEADETAKHLKQTASISDSTSFDPFDIVGFQSLNGGKYHIPIIKKYDSSEIPIHFIRRLSGNMSGRGTTWGKLKETRPDIFYKFTGIQHDTFNPLGAKIPPWMWMNPLNPALTDKALDAVLTDPKLIRRFAVANAIDNELKRKNPDWTAAHAIEERRKILSLCESFIPESRLLRRMSDGLFSDDIRASGTLTNQEIEQIKSDRRSLVLKLDTLHGYSGGGIYVGKSFFLNEVPRDVIQSLSKAESNIVHDEILNVLSGDLNESDYKILAGLPLKDLFKKSDLVSLFSEEYRSKESLAHVASEMEARAGNDDLRVSRNIIWPHLIDYALDQRKSMIQRYKEPHPFNAIRLSYTPDKGVEVSPPHPHIVDVNPFTFGTRVSYVHGRGSILGKTNITGYYGARMLNIPSGTAQRIAQLYTDLKKQADEALTAPDIYSSSPMPLPFSLVSDALLKGTRFSTATFLNPLTSEQLEKFPQGIAINSPPRNKGYIYAHTTTDDVVALPEALAAAQRSASLIISSSRPALEAVNKTYPNIALILMENREDMTRNPVIRGLRPLAEALRDSISASSLCISGTSGKTTTQDLTRSILAPITHLVSTHGNDNNIWGTTIELLRVTHETDCLLFEFGTNGHGQTALLSQLTKPTIAYTSSIGIDHWNAVDSLEKMLQLETEQYEWMLKNTKNPIFLANIDHEILRGYFEANMGRFILGGAQVHTLSATPGNNAHYQLENVVEYMTGAQFFSQLVINTPHGKVEANVPLIGEHNYANIIGAVALSLSTGKVKISDVQRGLNNPRFTGNRSEFFMSPLGPIIFNDSRISSPNAFPFAVKALMRAKELSSETDRAIAVLGDMWNLGDKAAEFHEDMGKVARELGVDALYAHGPNAVNYLKGFAGDGKSFETREELFQWIIENELSEDKASKVILMVKGGRKTLTYEMADWFRHGQIN